MHVKPTKWVSWYLIWVVFRVEEKSINFCEGSWAEDFEPELKNTFSLYDILIWYDICWIFQIICAVLCHDFSEHSLSVFVYFRLLSCQKLPYLSQIDSGQ